MEITGTTRIADLAVAYPATIRVFRARGIDFCCGGQRPVAEACAETGIAFDTLKAELAEALRGPAPDTFDWTGAPLDEVVTRIIQRYHVWLRRELPVLGEMAAKVARVHGERHPEVREVAATLAAITADLDPHMMKEERVLFPYIAEMARAARSGGGLESSCFGSVENPIRMMEMEHEAVGGLLDEMRRQASGYVVPDDGCNTFRGLYHGLLELERELHEHIHVENNVLHVRAKALEAQLLEVTAAG
ncbi:MAG TPA: iron-sulfur cluster repair di-iron protein [Vicinamibacteria bacterium]|nr:iron-sulfur cluster repair di-iron protein [Vicinamibacteria bacterium]